jgi:hypothetical protein
VTEEPSVPSEPRISAVFEASTPQSAPPPALGAQTPGQQTIDSLAGAQPQPSAPYGAVPEAGPAPLTAPFAPVQEPWPAAPTTATATATATATGKPRRAALIGGVGLAYVLLAAGTAAAVVAAASPAPVNIAALTNPATAANTSAAASSAAPKATPPTTVAPTPTSTVTGSVSNGVHHGDLRYFLLPAPDGPSSVQGAPDGTAESESDVVSEYGTSSDSSEIKSALKQLDFQAGATRTYQDSSLGANVTVELLQFGSHGDAKQWLGFFSGVPSGDTKLTIPGESGSTGWSSSDPNDESYSLVGMFVSGDTFFNVTVYGDQELADGALTNVMTDEYNRLATG